MAASSNPSKVIGIDLGTTFTKFAVFHNDKPKTIQNKQGDRTMPSWVAYTDTETVVGKVAVAAWCRAGNKIYDAKRMLGLRFDDSKIQDKIKDWPFKVVSVSDKPKIQVECKARTESYSPEEISAEVLKYIRQSACNFFSCEVTRAVVTIPAYFNNSQRQATMDAARLAGLEVLRLLSEPVAAAMAYVMDRNYEIQGNILIYDLGGGTFDVSILKVDRCRLEVLATNGNTHLGGEDFTTRLLNHVIETLKIQHGIVVFDGKKKENLRIACEMGKKLLVDALECQIVYDDAVAVCVTRAEFNELNRDLFDQTLQCVQLALDDAKLVKSDIQKIVMVGGSSRIEKIQRKVSEYFEKELTMSIDVEEVVSQGAAILAAKLNGDPSSRLNDLVLTDITPLSLGVKTKDEDMTIVVKRNSRIPLSVSHNFTTFHDNQTEAKFNVYEGERPLVKDNTFLGSFLLENIPPAPRGIPSIQTAFNLNSNGILTVTATDTGTGNTNDIVITIIR